LINFFVSWRVAGPKLQQTVQKIEDEIELD
jgi:hypothetical protein